MNKLEGCSCLRKRSVAFLIFHTLFYDFFPQTYTQLAISRHRKAIVDKCMEDSERDWALSNTAISHKFGRQCSLLSSILTLPFINSPKFNFY